MADVSTGGDYVLSATSASGGTSTGGSYSLNGWIASSGAGTSSGGELTLVCGVFDLYAAPSGDALLRVALTVEGKVRIWWVPSGYQLEFSPVLGGEAVWQNVVPNPAGNEWTAEPSAPSAYFRLRKL
jgi:hypothetical protein